MIIIILALWTTAIITFLYKQHLDSVKSVYILISKNSSLEDIKNLWICTTSTNSVIDYNMILDQYKLTCSWSLWKNMQNFINIKTFSGCFSSDNFCVYKIKK